MKFVTAATVIAMTLASCGKTAKQNASANSASQCVLASSQQDRELHLITTSDLNQVSAKAELVLGASRVAISNLLAAQLHQLILAYGSARTNLSIEGECIGLHVERGSLVDIYKGYSAYESSIIAAARTIHVAYKSGKLNNIEAANQLFDLYLNNPTSAEKQSLEILRQNGISTEDLRAVFVRTTSRDVNQAIFASSWDRLTHGLLISNAAEIRYLLPDPSKCELDLNDWQSPAERLKAHDKCRDDRNALRSNFFAASYAFAINSQTTTTISTSLDGRIVNGGEIKAEPIRLSDISDHILKDIKQSGSMVLNY